MIWVRRDTWMPFTTFLWLVHAQAHWTFFVVAEVAKQNKTPKPETKNGLFFLACSLFCWMCAGQCRYHCSNFQRKLRDCATETQIWTNSHIVVLLYYITYIYYHACLLLHLVIIYPTSNPDGRTSTCATCRPQKCSQKTLLRAWFVSLASGQCDGYTSLGGC